MKVLTILIGLLLLVERSEAQTVLGGLLNPVQAAAGGSWSPTDLGSTLKLWLKADAGATNSSDATPPNDGDGVKGWADQSGSGNFVWGQGGGNNPTYKTAIQNGLPIMRMTAASSQSFTNVAIATAFSGTDKAMTFAMVVSYGATNSAMNHMTLYNTGDADSLWVNQTTAAGVYGHTKRDDGGTLDSMTGGNATAGAWHVVVMTTTGTSVKWFVDGTQSGSTDTVDVGAITFNVFRIGRSQGSVYATCDIAEYLLCDTALSDGDRNSMEDYLQTRWGTP